jgi:hypothetical protein
MGILPTKPPMHGRRMIGSPSTLCRWYATMDRSIPCNYSLASAAVRTLQMNAFPCAKRPPLRFTPRRPSKGPSKISSDKIHVLRFRTTVHHPSNERTPHCSGVWHGVKIPRMRYVLQNDGEAKITILHHGHSIDAKILCTGKKRLRARWT